VIEWPLLLFGGLLGSAHCAGMCGGFALTLGTHAPSWRSNLARQLIYGGGRLFTYAALGAIAGYGGRKLVASATVVNIQAWLAIAAGLLLLWQGLAATGFLRRTRRIKASSFPCLGPSLLGTLLRTRGAIAPLAAGVVTGLLPCGLVYAFVALAVSSGTMGRGMITMIAFGVGTLPVMTALGLGTSLLGLTARQHLLKAAAWCVVLTGVLSIARGATAFQSSSSVATTPTCPFCSSRDTPASRIPNAAAAITTPETVSKTTSSPTP
jgi:sulfite exporter TauE/SafE